jgi:biopolymer transport protein ExbD
MKIRHQTASLADKIELNMTPMIDCVFQLLAFFIMSLKFVAPEGDFNIRMPAVAPSASLPSPELIPPIIVRLTANPDGSLKSIYVSEQFVPSFDALRAKVNSIVGTADRGPAAAGDGAEVEFDFDPDLLYQYVIEAITHVSGYKNEQGDLVRLVDKIKFKPPK